MNNNFLIILTNEFNIEIFDIKIKKSKYYHGVIYSATKGIKLPDLTLFSPPVSLTKSWS